jgi:hypothetical protein
MHPRSRPRADVRDARTAVAQIHVRRKASRRANMRRRKVRNSTADMRRPAADVRSAAAEMRGSTAADMRGATAAANMRRATASAAGPRRSKACARQTCGEDNGAK